MSDGLRTIKCWCTGQGGGADSLVHILRIEVLRGGDIVCGGDVHVPDGLGVLEEVADARVLPHWYVRPIPDIP